MPGIAVDGTYGAWQRAARQLLRENRPPKTVRWIDTTLAQGSLAGLDDGDSPGPAAAAVAVPRAFVKSAQTVAMHREPSRWALLYRMLWRITRGERHLLEDEPDPDVRRLRTLEAQVRRDIHKMHAFVRFREVADGETRRYVAWHRPDHLIVAAAAPFFVERFRVMRWSILTPDRCAHWDGERLTFSPGAQVHDAPAGDALEGLWRTYYASMFNPARVNRRAMTREMPVRHWATLPEATLIPGLLAGAGRRVAAMVDTPAPSTSARRFIPAGANLATLQAAATTCEGCTLHRSATQVVFGEGPPGAAVMLVGEQPGDEEDTHGVPFIGPAGQVLNEALVAAGLPRAELYVTNAVKHFTFTREGKRRLHERPRASDARACRPWLDAEIAEVRPRVIVCLGSVAMGALLGPGRRVSDSRGQLLASPRAGHVVVTFHPSAVLRAASDAERARIRAALIADLTLAREASMNSSADGAPLARLSGPRR